MDSCPMWPCIGLESYYEFHFSVTPECSSPRAWTEAILLNLNRPVLGLANHLKTYIWLPDGGLSHYFSAQTPLDSAAEPHRGISFPEPSDLISSTGWPCSLVFLVYINLCFAGFPLALRPAENDFVRFCLSDPSEFRKLRTLPKV